MNDDHETDNRPAAKPDTDRPQPGAVYRCPHCDIGTLDFRRLREHWLGNHAAEHGPLAHADITVEEGP